jgi:haloalkane dehalogenase
MANAARATWAPEVFAAYEAPFPTAEHKVGAWRLPLIVPRSPTDPGAAEMAAVHAALGSWEGPTQVLLPMATDLQPRGRGRLAAHPGAGDLEVVAGAGHFLQEDAGSDVAARLVAFLSSS